MVNDFAIVVVSFDGYSDVWDYFFECKKLYWEDCKYKTYLITNNKDYEADCSVVKTGDEINWCDRVENALKSIKENNILLLLEDYLIGKKIDNNEVEKYFSFFMKKNANYLRLINIPKKHGINKKKKIYSILENEEYGISLQPAIWKKDFLKKTLDEVEADRSAWDFEITLLKQCTEKSTPMDGCYGTKDNVLDVHNGVLKGKWFRNEVSYFREKGIMIDTTQRGILANKDYYSHLVRRNVRENIPPSLRKNLKKILTKFNFKFVSNV